MATSINTALKAKADLYLLGNNSTERTKITTSIAHLKENLKRYFGTNILSVDEFGSFKRGTILPRNYDQYSDVDLLIVFNHANINVHPSTYRNHLKSFAETYYPRSTVYKSSPTVTLELDHIKYDLVPCYKSSQYYIPQTDTSWMTSDIYGFNSMLTTVNTRYDYIVKPIIRLFKAWNSKVGYPYDSYCLEQEIANVNFVNENYQSGFFYAAKCLSTTWKSATLVTKVDALRNNIENVKYYLNNDNLPTAMNWLAHILP